MDDCVPSLSWYLALLHVCMLCMSLSSTESDLSSQQPFRRAVPSMLWNASRRWSANRVHQSIHRILVYNSPQCNPCPLLSSRRESSSASASALLRVDAPMHRPGPVHEIQEIPAVLRKKPGQQYRAKLKQTVTKNSGPILQIPDEFLQYLDEHQSVPVRLQAVILYQHVRLSQDWSRFLKHTESVAYSALELARTDSPQRALYILQAAHRIGTTLKQNVYEGVVHAFACGRHWPLVLGVVSDVLGATGKTSVRLLNWRGLALLKTQNYAELGSLLEEFAKYGLRPRQRTFLLILQGHLRNHDLARTTATIRSMERAGFLVDESTFNVIIPAYRGFGLDDFVLERGYGILSSSQPVQNKEKILNGLLRLHLDKHELQGALKLLETFSSRQKHPEDSTEHGESYVGGADGTDQERTLEDQATYTVLINYLSKYGPGSLSGILKRMRDHCGMPDIKTASALIRMHYLRGEEHDALVVLRDCCHHCDLRLDEMKHLGYDPQRSASSGFAPFKGYPTTELFNRVLHGAIQIRGLEVALPVLRLMNDAKLKPDVGTLDALLFHLSKERFEKKRRLRPAHLVKFIQRLQSADVQPTLATLNIILQLFVERTKYTRQGKGLGALTRYANRTKQAFRFPEREKLPMLRELRLEPTFEEELCVADLQDSALSEALEIIQSLRHRRILADRATFAIRMKYDILSLRPKRAPEAVAQHLQIMRDRGLHPNVYHYAALMEACCVAGDIQAAEDVLQDTVQRGLVPLQKSYVILYTVLISAYARSGRPDFALKTFHEMLNAGVSPDVASIDALVGAFYAARAKRLARRVLLDVWPMVAPFPVELREAKLPELIARLREIGARAKVRNPDIERQPIRSGREWRDLSRKIISEWRGDRPVQMEDDDDHDSCKGERDSGNDA